MVLTAYRVAAEIASWIAAAGKLFWPARWRVPERLSPRANPSSGRKAVWIHAASLGECKGSWALARALREAGLDDDFVLTANTDAGLQYLCAEIARDTEPSRWRPVIAPLDHPRVARRFLKAHGVCALVVFEVELWPFWFLEARRAGVPVSWVSARWNARARRRYGVFPAAARRVLGLVSWTQAQSDEDADALRRAGCSRVEVGGDLRGLSVLRALGDARSTGWSERDGIAFVSFHAREGAALVPMLRGAPEGSPLAVFPRKPEECGAFLTALAPLGFVAHSQDPNAARRVVDRFGLVDETLRRTRGAVIGGSFAGADSIGGHNLWEPLLAGCRVATGPHHANQAWLANRLRAAGLLRVLPARPGRGGVGNGASEPWAAFLAECDAPPDNDRGAKIVEKARAELLAAARTIRDRIPP